MKRSSWKWIAVVMLAVVCIAILIWATRSPVPPPQPGPSSQRPEGKSALSQSASTEPAKAPELQPEIIRPAHSSPATRQPDGNAPPGKADGRSLDIQSPSIVRKSPAQLNRGVGTLRNVAMDGEMATATVTTPDKNSYQLHPNQVGRFERVYVNESDIVSAQVTYPGGQEGQPVHLLVLDGGKLDNGKLTQSLSLDSKGGVAFNFQVTEQLGVHRVKLMKGMDQKILDFWVGQPLARAK